MRTLIPFLMALVGSILAGTGGMICAQGHAQGGIQIACGVFVAVTGAVINARR